MGKDLSQDIFPMMENEFNIALSYAELRIQATLADTDEVRYLDYPTDSPVLKIRRLVFIEASQPVAIEILSYRGDTFRYHLRAER